VKTVTISKRSLLRIGLALAIVVGLALIAADVIRSRGGDEGGNESAEAPAIAEGEQDPTGPTAIAITLAKAEANDADLWRHLEKYDALMTPRAQAEMRIKASQVLSYLDEDDLTLRLEQMGEPEIEETSTYTVTVRIPMTVIISSPQGDQTRSGTAVITLVKQQDGRWLADNYQSEGEEK